MVSMCVCVCVYKTKCAFTSTNSSYVCKFPSVIPVIFPQDNMTYLRCPLVWFRNLAGSPPDGVFLVFFYSISLYSSCKFSTHFPMDIIIVYIKLSKWLYQDSTSSFVIAKVMECLPKAVTNSKKYGWIKQVIDLEQFSIFLNLFYPRRIICAWKNMIRQEKGTFSVLNFFFFNHRTAIVQAKCRKE